MKNRMFIYVAVMALSISTIAWAGDAAETETVGGVETESQQNVSFSTVKEAREAGVDTGYSTWDMSDHYIMIIQLDGRYVRVIADVDKETAQKRDEIYDAMDDDMDDQLIELADPLPVAYTEDITGSIKDRTELDQTVGKTVAELEDEGYEIISSGCGGDDANAEFTMANGLFCYDFVMNEKGSEYEKHADDEDFEDFTVKSCSGVSGVSDNAMDLCYQADGTYVPEEES